MKVGLVVAFVPNMMDRSRFPALVRFVTTAAEVGEATTVIVDVDRCDDLEGFAGLAAEVIGFGSHVDEARLARATELGFAEVMARSVFFRRLAALMAARGVGPEPNGAS